MPDSFSERWAARKDPRFRAFAEGKRAYEAFLRSLAVPFHEMSEEQYRLARKDPKLRAAMESFGTALSMSEREGELADAAVAKCQLAEAHHARGELDKADSLIRAALRILSNLPNQDRASGISLCHYQLGVIAMKQKRYPEAVRELRHSRKIDEARADRAGVKMCEQALASCAMAGADIDYPAPETPEAFSIQEPSEQVGEPVSEDPPLLESEQESEPIRYGQRQVIFLVSHTVEANDALMTHLNALGNEFGRPVAVSRAATGATDPQQRHLREPDSAQHPCAAILILEKAGVQDPLFREWATAFMQRTSIASDFRLLVYLHDLTMEELREWSDREPMIAMLFDTTQIAESPSLEQLRRTLVPYVRRVERIQAEAMWRVFRTRMATVCGHIAFVVLVIAAVIALLGYPLWWLISSQSGLGPFAPAMVSLFLGFLFFPVLAPLIFLLLRGLRFTALAPRDVLAFMRWICVGFVFMLLANTVIQRMLDGPDAWLFLGLVGGIVLDAVRRAGRQARRQAINLEALLENATDSTWREPANTVRQEDPLKPFSCPLLPSLSPRVFISYTRSSTKGIQLATSLYRKLKAEGATPFLDRASIPEGANWRQALNRQLGECDVFICILDERSVQREWVAAEVLAAIESRRITGGPEIILLMDPAIRNGSRPMLPLFAGIVAAADDPPMPGCPRIVLLNEDTPTALAWGLAPGRFTSRAVFPQGALLSVKYPAIGLLVLAGLGVPAGLMLGFFTVLEGISGFPFRVWLMEHGGLIPLALLASFWLGYNARITVIVNFEREHTRGVVIGLPILVMAGLAIFCLASIPQLSALVAGWAVVLLIWGWMLIASAICKNPARHNIGRS